MPSINLPQAKIVKSPTLKFGSVSVGAVLIDSKKEESKPTDSLNQLENAVKDGVFKNDIGKNNE